MKANKGQKVYTYIRSILSEVTYLEYNTRMGAHKVSYGRETFYVQDFLLERPQADPAAVLYFRSEIASYMKELCS